MVDWLNISATSGSGDATITITATSHTELTRRLAAIKFKNTEHNLTAQTSVVQDAYVPEPIHVVVNPTSIDNIPQSGGSYEICVQSNGDWTVQVPSWATSTITSGSGNQCFTVTVDENDKESMNIGDVVISSVDETKNIPLIQAGVDVCNLTFIGNCDDEYDKVIFPVTGGSVQVRVLTTHRWSTTINSANNWLTVSPSSGTGSGYVTMTAAPNTGDVGKRSYVSTVFNEFTSEGSCTYPIRAYSAALKINKDLVYEAEGIVDDSPYTIGDYDAVSSTADWLHVRKDGRLYITVDEYNGVEERTAIIQFFWKGILIFEKEVRQIPSYVPEGGYFTLEAIESGSIVKIVDRNLQYKINDGDWYNVSPELNETMSRGDKIYLRGTGTFASSENTFSIRGNVKVYGNAMSLIDYTNISDTAPDSCFKYLFKDCTGLTDASGLILPASTVGENSYSWMFSGCTSLVSAPELPATSLRRCSYQYMFYECLSLINAPSVLPATLATWMCYYQMFTHCDNLVTAPVISATAVSEHCCTGMFEFCSSLVNAPELLAEEMAQACYHSMFYGCTSLVNAPALPAKWLASSCYASMFEDCTSLVTAPVLPASKLYFRCYSQMFRFCTNLNYVKIDAIDLGDEYTYATDNWLQGVPTGGTFVKKAGVNYPTGMSGIPSGWTVIEE